MRTGAIAVIAGVVIAVLPLTQCSPSTEEDKPAVTTPQAQPQEVKKFGLTEEQRKQVFREEGEAELRASREAEAKYPGADARYSEYQTTLVRKYQQQIMDKYTITLEQLYEIVMEGARIGWR